MMSHQRWRSRALGIATTGLTILVLASNLHAQCLAFSTQWVPEAFRASALVFTGTLLENQPGRSDRMIFRADRIWKGKPTSPDIVVYVIGDRNLHSLVFGEGRDRGERSDASSRSSFGFFPALRIVATHVHY